MIVVTVSSTSQECTSQECTSQGNQTRPLNQAPLGACNRILQTLPSTKPSLVEGQGWLFEQGESCSDLKIDRNLLTMIPSTEQLLSLPPYFIYSGPPSLLQWLAALELYSCGRPSIHWAFYPTRSSFLLPCIAGFCPSYDDSQLSEGTFAVGIPSTEPCVSLDRFSYQHVLPASFPPVMTPNSSKLYFCGQNSIYWVLSH